ncbi:MAG: phosphoribosylamine--glycine ligase [Sphingobacteriales bacterium]|jgi:phosphoribosylamine--glycine ligase
MNILILGSGGREHAFAWKISQGKDCEKLFIAPGNPGTAKIGGNVDLSLSDFPEIERFCVLNEIGLVVVGPEDPLVNGIVDFFKSSADLKNVLIIGPDKSGAILEGSKDFAKEFMAEFNIPTAAYETFDSSNLSQGFDFIDKMPSPIVLKADGLAAGKGVLIIEDKQEAKEELRAMIEEQKFGSASAKVVIEQFLKGIELSVFILTDGEDYLILPEAKDYKRIGEGDTGLNTGGMGAISPVPFVDAEFMQKIEDRVVKPTINGLKSRKIDYKGFIFIGLIKVENEPLVIEYNVRMGDPETEVVLPRIKSDFLDILIKTGRKQLKGTEIKCVAQSAATVMLVSGGYPEYYEKGKRITGLENITNSLIFHAGTKGASDELETNGGRVLCLTSFGDSVSEAAQLSISNAHQVKFDKAVFRKDIGWEFN